MGNGPLSCEECVEQFIGCIVVAFLTSGSLEEFLEEAFDCLLDLIDCVFGDDIDGALAAKNKLNQARAKFNAKLN
ncbi:hypothetical protein [Metabacillus arenae]|uniref:Uncharacterized protein n=1 Tax=Metabacillus arenae TaxID=2771434 RepID=A0A926S0A0_9BACI|nr:hypothetical protein [Metabacillus arenae]MBD1383057.1 hypothetical protein [Metabacillus arenae]